MHPINYTHYFSKFICKLFIINGFFIKLASCPCELRVSQLYNFLILVFLFIFIDPCFIIVICLYYIKLNKILSLTI